MSDQRVPTYIEPYKFRASLGLFFFGALQVLVGILCVLGFILSSIAIFAAIYRNAFADSTMTRRFLIALPLFTSVGSVWFITNGLGSIAGRRWARSLILVSSWVGLVVGITSLANFLATYNDIGQIGHLTKGMLLSGRVAMVVMPGLLVLFYGNKNTKAFCEIQDPQKRWTDQCPTPILVLSVMCGKRAFSSFALSILCFPLPIFGHIVSGSPSIILYVATGLAYVYLSWGTFKLRKEAWWCALALVALMLASTGINYSSGVTVVDTVQKTGLSAHEKELIVGKITPDASSSTPPQLVELAFFVGYLLYVSKYFKENSTGNPTPNQQPTEPIPARTLITRPRLT